MDDDQGGPPHEVPLPRLAAEGVVFFMAAFFVVVFVVVAASLASPLVNVSA